MADTAAYTAALERRITQLEAAVELLRRENEELRKAICLAINQLHTDNDQVRAYVQHVQGLTESKE